LPLQAISQRGYSWQRLNLYKKSAMPTNGF